MELKYVELEECVEFEELELELELERVELRRVKLEELEDITTTGS